MNTTKEKQEEVNEDIYIQISIVWKWKVAKSCYFWKGCYFIL